MCVIRTSYSWILPWNAIKNLFLYVFEFTEKNVCNIISQIARISRGKKGEKVASLMQSIFSKLPESQKLLYIFLIVAFTLLHILPIIG